MKILFPARHHTVPACILLAFCLCFAALPAVPAPAGQTINITSDHIGPVHGNSTSPDGSDHYAPPNDNTLIIHNGVTVTGSAFGGNNSILPGNAGNNSVFINGGWVAGDVYGGWVTGNGVTVTNNSVTIKDGYARDDVCGGHTQGGVPGNGNAAIYNSVSIIGNSEVGRGVYGGQSAHDNAMYNSVTISGGKVARSTRRTGMS